MRLVAILTLAFVSAVGTVRAAPAAAPEPSDAGKRSDAQRRFQRGIELYKAGDFGPALVEFKRAYELVPSYKILYNLGQVSYQRRDHAAALRYFRQYLADGDDAIPAERRQEVNADIAELEQSVGRLQIDAAEEGAEVFVDDVLVGETPLRALITVNGGPRKIDLVRTQRRAPPAPGRRRLGRGRARVVSAPDARAPPPAPRPVRWSRPRQSPRPRRAGAEATPEPEPAREPAPTPSPRRRVPARPRPRPKRSRP